jgi:uncharacterized repeat protein (TIGR04138 family)
VAVDTLDMSLASTQSNPEHPHPALGESPYPEAAFRFVLEGLRFTTERACSQYLTEGLPLPDLRHVTGQQLCLGLREFALERFGPLAPNVLRHWNIHRTEDFGRIVYLLIETEQLAKSAEDSIDDFHAVFDFQEAFSDAAIRSSLDQVLSARVTPRSAPSPARRA